jgi:hypothetical protein
MHVLGEIELCGPSLRAHGQAYRIRRARPDRHVSVTGSERDHSRRRAVIR